MSDLAWMVLGVLVVVAMSGVVRATIGKPTVRTLVSIREADGVDWHVTYTLNGGDPIHARGLHAWRAYPSGSPLGWDASEWLDQQVVAEEWRRSDAS